MKVDILAISAHPDDVELSCSGTLLSEIALGKKVGIVDITRGELGTRGTPELRQKEAEDAAIKMGASFREILSLKDGFFTHSEENLKEIINLIRIYHPEIVLTNAHSDRHPDHGKAAKLVKEACFLSGLRKIKTKQGTAWRPSAVYHYIQDYYLKPDFVYDITPFIDKKIELIKCFKSQFYDPNSSEPDTPLTGSGFFDFIKSRAAEMGRPSKIDYAEGYQVNRFPAVNSLSNLI